MIEVESKKIPHSFRNKYLRNSGSVSLSTSTPMPSTSGQGVEVLKTDDIRTVSDSNVFSSLRSLLEIKSRIVAMSDKETDLSDENTFSSLRALKETQDIVDREILKALEKAESLFLSKTKDDKTTGHLTIDGGVTTDLLQSSQFTSGTLGSGHILKRDPNTGESYLEVDKAYIRKKAIFNSLEIKEAYHVGGEQIQTLASLKCTQVEYMYRESLFDSDHKRLRDSEGKYLFALLPEPVYRCYFVNDDGEKAILNQFVIGDFAQCRQFDIKSGVYEGVSNRYYWRYVSGIGDNYIDLSVDDCDEGSDIPAAGDNIIQLGNRTDADRQNAIIMSSYGENAPLKQMLQGIDSYSLADKVILEEGFDRLTNQAYTKTFGRSYVGDRDEKSYLKYVPGSGVEARCTIKGVSDDGNSVYELMPDGTCFFGTTDPGSGKKTGIIQGVDCMVVGEKRTGVFAVVDDEVVFELDPVNKKYKFIGNIESESITMKDLAHLASAIFKGNYMFSQYGKDASGVNSTDYENFNSEKPYTGDFVPNLLMNLLTGDFYCNNAKIDGVLQGTLKNKVIRYNAKTTELIEIDLNKGTDYMFYAIGTTTDAFVRLPHDKEHIGTTLRISAEAHMGAAAIHITSLNADVFLHKRSKGTKIQLNTGGYLELAGVPNVGAATGSNPSGIGNVCLWRIVNSADFEKYSWLDTPAFRSVVS